MGLGCYKKPNHKTSPIIPKSKWIRTLFTRMQVLYPNKVLFLRETYFLNLKKFIFCVLIFTVLCCLCHTATRIGQNYICIPSFWSLLPLPCPMPLDHRKAAGWTPSEGRQRDRRREWQQNAYTIRCIVDGWWEALSFFKRCAENRVEKYGNTEKQKSDDPSFYSCIKLIFQIKKIFFFKKETLN